MVFRGIGLRVYELGFRVYVFRGFGLSVYELGFKVVEGF